MNGPNYYRLRYQMDDGSETLSNTVEVAVEQDLAWRVGPNPLTETRKLTLAHNSAGPEKATVLIWDIQGKISFSQSLTIDRETGLDLSPLAAGIYTLQIIGNSGRWQQWLILP